MSCDPIYQAEVPEKTCMGPSEYKRNEREDLKTGLDYMFEFIENLSKLHPNASYLVRQLFIQRSI